MKTDKILVVVFGLIGLAIAGVYILSGMDRDTFSILDWSATVRPDGTADVNYFILGFPISSTRVADFEGFLASDRYATYASWLIIALTGFLLGAVVGCVVSRWTRRLSAKTPGDSPGAKC